MEQYRCHARLGAWRPVVGHKPPFRHDSNQARQRLMIEAPEKSYALLHSRT